MSVRRLVRIVSCNNPEYWYANKIGETYVITQDVVSDLFKIVVQDGSLDEFYLAEKDIIDITEERDNKLKELGI